MNFDLMISVFEKKNSAEIEKRIAENKEIILFLGRKTCPYCNIFLPKLYNVVTSLEKNIYFVDSSNNEDEFLVEFREKYGVKTVPALLVAREKDVKVVCDSSLSEEAIKQFII